ncbi:MAG: hypothetical protein EPO35_03840 [Acidobacteria bacterium]|nr:MAG: hypothetical protein EPO35_03840 [Acidobacteriota bacterium]
MSRVIGAAALAAVLTATSAYAQTPAAPAAASTYNESFFLGVSAGGLMNTTLVTSQATATIYNQNAAVAERRDVSGGLLVDVTAGKPIRGRLAVGASVSLRSATSDSALAASVPHPLFFDAPRTVSTTTPGMKSTQTWVGLLAMYTLPSSGKVTVRIFGGPAVAMVKHDTIGAFTVTEGTSIAQPTIAITKGSVSKSFIGAIGGFDLSFRVIPSIAIGAFVRYSGAQANVTGAESGTIGGLESGGGVRFSFSKK